MLSLNTAAALSTQIRLKLAAIFPQIMQQAGQFSLIGEAERGGEIFRQGCDVAEMRGERLPMTFVRIA